MNCMTLCESYQKIGDCYSVLKFLPCLMSDLMQSAAAFYKYQFLYPNL